MAQSARRSEDPLVIAHRGASGYLPEHTLPAYAFGYALGADYIEPDLVLTRDGVFICLHDIHLEATTDVEQRFPDRRRSDGRWYALDFDLAEIQSLNVHERLPGRYPQDRGRYQVPTFEEMIELVQGLNRSTGRDVGIYPELKAPTWHRTEGKPMEEAFLALLERHGYEGPDAMVFVQVFEKEPLRRMRELGSELPQVYLIGGMQRADLEEGSLRDIATFAQGIGPSKERTLPASRCTPTPFAPTTSARATPTSRPNSSASSTNSASTACSPTSPTARSRSGNAEASPEREPRYRLVYNPLLTAKVRGSWPRTVTVAVCRTGCHAVV